MIRLASTKQFDRLDKPQQRELTALMSGSKEVLGFLRTVLEDKVAEVDRNELLKGNYDCPNYSYLLADLIGTKRAYKDILNLLKEVDQTNE